MKRYNYNKPAYAPQAKSDLPVTFLTHTQAVCQPLLIWKDKLSEDVRRDQRVEQSTLKLTRLFALALHAGG